MYELLNARTTGEKESKKDITFDYEGKIIQIKKPNENNFPETLNNPKVKFKQGIVQGNILKEMLQQAKMKEKKQKDRSDITNTPEENKSPEKTDTKKRSNKLVD